MILLASKNYIMFENGLTCLKLRDINGVNILNLKKHFSSNTWIQKAAEEELKDFQVKVFKTHIFLEGVLGSPEKTRVRESITKEVECIKRFGVAAHKSPQATYLLSLSHFNL